MKSKLIYLIIVLGFFGGCVRGELSTDHGSLDVKVNWESLAEDLVPKSMTVNLYDEGTGVLTQHDDTTNYANASLFKESFSKGSYKMLAFSSDEIGIKIRKIEIREEAEAIILQKSDTKSTTVTFNQPNSFYGFEDPANLENIVIVPAENTEVTLRPKSYLKPVAIKVNMTGDVTLLGSAALSLVGIANGVNLSTGIPFADTGKTNIVIESDISPDNFNVVLNVFGVAPGATNTVVIDLFFVDTRSQKLSIDVTGEFVDLNELKSPGKSIEVDLEIHQDSNTEIHARLIDWNLVTLDIDIPLPSTL